MENTERPYATSVDLKVLNIPHFQTKEVTTHAKIIKYLHEKLSIARMYRLYLEKYEPELERQKLQVNFTGKFFNYGFRYPPQ